MNTDILVNIYKRLKPQYQEAFAAPDTKAALTVTAQELKLGDEQTTAFVAAATYVLLGLVPQDAFANELQKVGIPADTAFQAAKLMGERLFAKHANDIAEARQIAPVVASDTEKRLAAEEREHPAVPAAAATQPTQKPARSEESFLPPLKKPEPAIPANLPTGQGSAPKPAPKQDFVPVGWKPPQQNQAPANKPQTPAQPAPQRPSMLDQRLNQAVSAPQKQVQVPQPAPQPKLPVAQQQPSQQTPQPPKRPDYGGQDPYREPLQ